MTRQQQGRGLCLLRGEVVWNGNNSVNLWGRVEQG